MTKIYRLLLMTIVAAFLISCDQSADIQEVDMDEMFSSDVVDGVDTKVDAMEVKSVKFSPDHKYFSIKTSIIRDLMHSEIPIIYLSRLRKRSPDPLMKRGANPNWCL